MGAAGNRATGGRVGAGRTGRLTARSDGWDGSRKPVYDRLGLEFTPQAEATIREYTGGHNVAAPDAAVGTDATRHRNSAENLWQWRKRLSDEEFENVRSGVADVSTSFYSDQEW